MTDAQRGAKVSDLDRIRGLLWQTIFHKTVDNPLAPGGKIDMYILIDDDTGENLVSLGVPHGQRWLAEYVALCCADPFFVRGRDIAGDLAAEFNRCLKPRMGKDDTIDAREVHAAAMAIVQGYVGAMPKRSRQELIDSTIKILRQMREAA
jgi:hypothetical protein